MIQTTIGPRVEEFRIIVGHELHHTWINTLTVGSDVSVL